MSCAPCPFELAAGSLAPGGGCTSLDPLGGFLGLSFSAGLRLDVGD